MANDRAYAASQFRTTRLSVAVVPRSTCSHCASLNALDQRVPVLPSTALAAAKSAFSALDAVAVLPCDSRVSAACAETTVRAAYPATSTATTALSTRLSSRGRRLGRACDM